ncbi:hypothetical protein [Parerythrobacter lacustris]|uniref:Uncharacterized protein n=1 Tax=Parerythrobacter lacustris TaxID=2969984 RepID=A0ABT1XMK6_9SPHN|nr:hypothetical protein [Parerythrobacter lacustris]MCR2832894.1 hypothetical protein [Parerythrobacter lacustris]
MVKTRGFASLAIAALALQGSPVAAQDYSVFIADVIGQTIANMNSYAPPCGYMPDNELAEARDPAPGVMQGYFDAARNGGDRARFFKLDNKTTWRLGEREIGSDGLNAQADPLAVEGNRLDPLALRFYRAGNYSTAQGQWAVLAPDGTVAGVYTGLFTRERGEWKLRELTVVPAGSEVGAIDQYCAEPGDLTDAAVTGGEQRIAWLEKQIADKEEDRQRDEARIATTEEKLAKRDSRSLRERLAREKRTLANRLESLETLRSALGTARDALDEAQKTRAELLALRGDARNALAFRIAEKDAEPANGRSE